MKRGAKSYNPYSSSQRVKKTEPKGKERLDILPNKHNVWLKQVCLPGPTAFCVYCNQKKSLPLLNIDTLGRPRDALYWTVSEKL